MVPALVLAARRDASLLPLTEEACVALLPVGGMPIIQHTLDDLAVAGVQQALVASPFAREIERALGDGGTPMQMAFDRVALREPAATTIARVAREWPREFVIVRGDILRTPALQWFLSRSLEVTGDCHLTIGGTPAGVQLVRSSTRWCTASPASDLDVLAYGTAVDMPDARLQFFDALSEYYDANVAAALGQWPGLLLGTPIRLGVIVGQGASVPPACIARGPVLVGSRSHVHPTATLGPYAILADRVVVDAAAALEHVLVMPGTHVPEGARFSRAIVGPHAIVDLRDGTVTRPDPPLEASPLESLVHDRLDDVVHRGLALVLLLCSAPLWPVMLAAALLANPRRPFTAVSLRGNRLTRASQAEWQFARVEVWRAAASAPLLAHLPYLLAAVSGHLRLVGVRPLTPEEEAAYPREWRWARSDAPVGLVGPGQLAALGNCDGDDPFLAESEYAQARTLVSDLAWLVRGAAALVHRRAWVPAPKTTADETRLAA